MLGISENCVLPARLKEAEKLRDALQRELTALFHKSPWWEGLGGWGGGNEPHRNLAKLSLCVCLLVDIPAHYAGCGDKRPKAKDPGGFSRTFPSCASSLTLSLTSQGGGDYNQQAGSWAGTRQLAQQDGPSTQLSRKCGSPSPHPSCSSLPKVEASSQMTFLLGRHSHQ